MHTHEHAGGCLLRYSSYPINQSIHQRLYQRFADLDKVQAVPGLTSQGCSDPVPHAWILRAPAMLIELGRFNKAPL
ncbi:MAG: hypothetical protein JWP80_926 [Pseudomonas sp.]|nr:hypothetical protein [Pseudomonas sp.]